MADPSLYLFDGYNLLHAGDRSPTGASWSTRWRASSRCAARAGSSSSTASATTDDRGPLAGALRRSMPTRCSRASRSEQRSRRPGDARDERLDGGRCRGWRGCEALLPDVHPRLSSTRRAPPQTPARAGREARRGDARAGSNGPAQRPSKRVQLQEGLVLFADPCYIHLKLRVRLRWLCRTKPQNDRNHGGAAVAVRTATAPKSPQKVQRELEDLQLVLKARNGSRGRDGRADPPLHLVRPAEGELVFPRRRRLRGSDPGGSRRSLQGRARLPADKETSFRSFAELCVTRQIITAIKTATRFKHAPLNTYVSFSHTPAGQDGDDCTLGDALPGPGGQRPVGAGDLDRGAAGARRLPRRRRSRRSRPTRCASTSKARRTSRWRRISAATRRRSTTPCSA